mgnify:CR=1 FL=1
MTSKYKIIKHLWSNRSSDLKYVLKIFGGHSYSNRMDHSSGANTLSFIIQTVDQNGFHRGIIKDILITEHYFHFFSLNEKPIRISTPEYEYIFDDDTLITFNFGKKFTDDNILKDFKDEDKSQILSFMGL